jgi:amidase
VAANDLLTRSVTELAGLVREGEVTATELVDASLERIDAVNPELNAFVLVDDEGARAAAAEIGPGDPRPFAGVPIAIKDEVPVAGLRLTLGSDIFGDFTPEHDSFVVRRLREAGFVIVGRTSMPEMGLLPITEPRRYGPTRNPWDTDRTPGGSSGGSASAVAGGLVPIGHARDGGGSIRIPAACCGLVGLKPSRGRISVGPEQGEHFLVTDGVVTRTVAETAALLDVLAGYEPGDASWAPPPPEPFAEAARREPQRLRIGVTTAPSVESELDPLHEQAVRDTAELLASLGHEVAEVRAPWEGQDLLQVFTAVFGAHVSMGVFFGAAVTGREPSPDLVEPLTWHFYEHARSVDSISFLLGKGQLEAMTRAVVGGLWAEHDVVLMPILAQRPLRIGEIDPSGDDPAEEFRKAGRFVPYGATFNITGQPAISLPLFHGDDGLPTAVQLVGAPAGEAVLLSLSAQLEAARPWADRRPPLAAAAA